MKTTALSFAALAFAAANAVAQAQVNPTDPQPTCTMCPGTYIPLGELESYTKKAVAEKLVDQQVRDIDIGKAHVGIGMVHRGKLDMKIMARGAQSAALVASGEAGIVVQPISELVHVPGLDFVGPIPAELQLIQTFAAAIVAGSTEVEAARQLIAYLASDRAGAAIENNGMEPVGKR